ncbi:helix-turn-helix domain-containing protein [Sinorhizobium meliloti]|nr:helix-turn-helix domain-containing protein [Sinorhizobium meliloti]
MGNQKKPHPVDIQVGGRIRLRRTMLGMSQETLADSLGITFQQVQKYEKGTNRVGASRLQSIASSLNAPVSFFFEERQGALGGSASDGADKPITDDIEKFISTPEGVRLNRAFAKISSATQRRKLVELVKALAATYEVE